MLDFFKKLFSSSPVVQVEETKNIPSFTVKNTEQMIVTTTDYLPKNSSILFEIDDDLEIKIKSNISPDVIPALIKEDYFTEEQSEDESVLQYCFILIANEATEQIIMGVNDDAPR